MLIGRVNQSDTEDNTMKTKTNICAGDEATPELEGQWHYVYF